MSGTHALDILFKYSGTPTSCFINTNSSPVFSGILKSLSGIRDTDKKRFGEESYHLFANILAPPLDLTSILFAKEQLRFLINTLCKWKNIKQEDTERIDESLESFLKTLENYKHEKTDHKKSRFLKRHERLMEDYPILAFHVDSGMKPGLVIRNSYKVYGLACHVGLRKSEKIISSEYERRKNKDKLALEMFYRMSLSLRIFIKNAVVIGKEEGTFTVPFKEEIENAIDRYAYSKEDIREEDEDTETISGHKKRVKRVLLEDLNRIIRDAGGTSGKRSISEDDDDLIPRKVRIVHRPITIRLSDIDETPSVGRWRSKKRRGTVSIWRKHFDVPRKALEEGECPDDYMQDILFDDDEEIPIPGRTDRPSRKKKINYFINWSTHRYYWDKNYLQADSYRILYKYIEGKWEKSGLNGKAFSLFTSILMQMGFSPVKLAQMEMGIPGNLEEALAKESVEVQDSIEEQPEESLPDLFFDQENMCFCYVITLESIGWYIKKVDPFIEKCLPATRMIMIPVPEKMIGMVCDYIHLRNSLAGNNEKYFFLGQNKRGEVKPLSLPKFKRYLNEINISHSQSITFEAISKSFYPLYVDRFGMDPIIASYISGKIFRENRAKVFYTNVSAERIALDHKRILGKIDVLFGEGKKDKSDTQYAIPFRQVEKATTLNPRFGSRCVPRKENLRFFFRTIRNTLEQISITDPSLVAAYHNLYTFYCFIGLQFATAHRLIKDPNIPVDGIFFRDGILLIADKNNRVYAEERLTVISEPVLSLLRELCEGRQVLISRLRAAGYFDIEELEYIGNPMFFFVEEDGIPYRLGPGTIRMVLGTFEKLKDLYPYPLSAPRHYLSTYLLDAGLDRTLIDAFLGHQSFGMEFTGRFSTASLNLFFKEISPIIRKMLMELGVVFLEYRLKKQ